MRAWLFPGGTIQLERRASPHPNPQEREGVAARLEERSKGWCLLACQNVLHPDKPHGEEKKASSSQASPLEEEEGMFPSGSGLGVLGQRSRACSSKVQCEHLFFMAKTKNADFARTNLVDHHDQVLDFEVRRSVFLEELHVVVINKNFGRQVLHFIARVRFSEPH